MWLLIVRVNALLAERLVDSAKARSFTQRKNFCYLSSVVDCRIEKQCCFLLGLQTTLKILFLNSKSKHVPKTKFDMQNRIATVTHNFQTITIQEI